MSQVGIQKFGVPFFLQHRPYMDHQNNRRRGEGETFMPLLAFTEPLLNSCTSKNHIRVMLMYIIL